MVNSLEVHTAWEKKFKPLAVYVCMEVHGKKMLLRNTLKIDTGYMIFMLFTPLC